MSQIGRSRSRKTEGKGSAPSEPRTERSAVSGLEEPLTALRSVRGSAFCLTAIGIGLFVLGSNGARLAEDAFGGVQPGVVVVAVQLDADDNLAQVDGFLPVLADA